jgi:hypothetical protein
MPLHMPSWQTYGHDAVDCQSPSPLQLCRLAPSHRFSPGAHVPTQPCSLQSVVHSIAVSQVPLALHVDVIDISHFIEAGVHIPVHAPFVQR